MAKHHNEFPQVKNYLSVTSYLQDVYAFRKSMSAGFSYDSWAAELGLKSRSFMKMLVDGERAITSQTLEALILSLGFSPEENNYFRLIVAHSQSESPDEKTLYMEKIFEVLGQSRDLIEIQQYGEFLSSTELPKIQVLLSFNDLPKTSAELAVFLKKTEEEVGASLVKLANLGLASQDEISGEWKAIKKAFKVPKSFGNEALVNYHNQSLMDAIEAQKLPVQVRRFRSLLVALTEEDYEKLLGDIEALVSKSIAKYDSDMIANKRLYKMNINLHPVTETFIELTPRSQDRDHN